MIRRILHSFNIFITPLLVMILMTHSVKTEAQTTHSVDSLYIELSKATTPVDSVAILHNLYDCLFFDDRKPVLFQIFETAERAEDYTTMLETLFVLTSLYQYDTELEKNLIEMAQRVPESENQKAIILYIKLRYQATNLNLMSEAERQHKLHQALKNYREHNKFDKYDRIAFLFLICTNLRNSTDSELLAHYLQQLQEMIEEFPYDELYVRTLFYTMAINIYIDHEMYDRALAANRRILDIVAQFDKRHESQGRIFRNYDGSLYQCYHNMLICGQYFTDEEIDMYYNRTREIAARNPRLNKDRALQNRTNIYYLMAKKRYAEALPGLKEQVKSSANKSLYYNFATLLVKAARETGDKEALLQGSKIINSIRKDRLQAKSDISLSELLTIYDVEDLKDQIQDLKIENRRMEIAQRQQSFIVVTIAIIVLIGILAWLLRLYTKSRKLARRLAEYNKKLVDERNSLKNVSAKLVDTLEKVKTADRTKSDFVENMSVGIRKPLGAIVRYSHLITDHVKEDERLHPVREYADAMSVNTDLLVRLVNDLLDLPQIESGKLSIQQSPTSVKNICNFALDVIKKHVAPGVEIVFANAGQPDITILTDPQRVEQVLIQILTNAAKFTEAGSITFGYEITQQCDKITFTVTDTGIGIAQDMAEKIFDRFVKIDPIGQGLGLGLYISRLLANMLGGTLTLDSSYRNGARFVFTIPIR